jgi:predicted Zn-dependent protease
LRAALASLLALLLASSACLSSAQSGSPAGEPRTGPPSREDISIEREKAMAADIHRQIRASAPLLADPELLDFLYEIGQDIVSHIEPQPFLYRFFIIDDDTLNAFTIGGGYIYVHSGTIAQAGDVEELAGLLAHEIAHVTQRHVVRRSEGQGLATLATLASLAAVALAGADPALLAIAQGINVSLQLKHSRAHEAEADREGLHYLVDAGYDPRGMQRFFQRILTEKPAAGMEIPAYLYTHPALEERIAGSRVQMERMEIPRIAKRDGSRLRAMQARLATLKTRRLPPRAEFDRSLTDELLARAGKATRAEEADEILAEAERREPTDPRVALARADWAEKRGDLEAAIAHVERAQRLDPSVPLVQYRLGLLHKKHGDRSRAVFWLEQAAAGFRPGSAGRMRAEMEIERIELPLFERSGLARIAVGAHAEPPLDDSRRFFRPGDRIVWWALLSPRYLDRAPSLDVTWRDANGAVVKRDVVRIGRDGRFVSMFDTKGRAAGRWSVAIVTGDSEVETRVFELLPPADAEH